MKWLRHKIDHPDWQIVLACLTGYAVWYAAVCVVAAVVIDWVFRHVRISIV